MSRRQDLHKARLRRERIRKDKHSQRAPNDRAPVPSISAFAMERSMREIHALMEDREGDSVETFNARLAELTARGGLSDMAQASKQDDPKWRAQELAYDALEADDVGEALELIKDALDLDPDCTDAQRLMVSILPAELDNKIQLMREVVEKAERNFGEVFFEEHKGHFWGALETRPYMRAMLHLGELLLERENLTEASLVFERMLELNPNDNLGVRYILLGVGLAQGELERVDRRLAEYPDEEDMTAVFAWARVMQRFLAGEEAEARTALSKARKVNRFAEPYLSGARRAPEPPEYYQPGDESDARICAQQLALACRRQPEFQSWLRSRK